ncbi:hypothetical protein MMC30_000188 [Trapelia coarctata]|nr:hypothetical protein [Trapelia coarctata]
MFYSTKWADIASEDFVNCENSTESLTQELRMDDLVSSDGRGSHTNSIKSVETATTSVSAEDECRDENDTSLSVEDIEASVKHDQATAAAIVTEQRSSHSKEASLSAATNDDVAESVDRVPAEIPRLVQTAQIVGERHCKDGPLCAFCETTAVRTIQQLALDTTGLISYLEKLEKTIECLQDQSRSTPLGTKLAEESPPIDDGATQAASEVEYIMEIGRRRKITSGTELDISDEESHGAQAHGQKLSQNKRYVLTSYPRLRFNPRGGGSTYDTLGYSLKINSKPILEVLRDVVQYYPGVSLEGDCITLDEPYYLVFHHQRQLTAYLKRDGIDMETHKHLSLLLNFMRDETGGLSEEIESFHSASGEKIISFSSCWLIYPPGSVVYFSKEGETQAYVVESIRPIDRTEIKQSLELRCWSIDYDGTVFGRTYTTLFMSAYNGSRKIANLDIVPAAYLSKKENDCKREALISRGRKFWSFQGSHHQEYRGKAWLEAMAIESARQEERAFPTDTTSTFTKYNKIDPESEPDEMVLLLCPLRVFGFNLRNKEWRELNVHHLQDVKFGGRGFKRLVLDYKYKTIVQALVQSYVEKKSTFKDLVAGKGRGLVALLHGAPGTGKTLTAECVADHFNRPLYMVTCGDIGVSPAAVEMNLAEIFEYAVQWKAVLLLDEADIFLQERNYQGLTRNAIVSIFLRTLEYFDGILFLTTNRVGQLDEAFRSRLHLTLHLPSLMPGDRKKIFMIFLADLEMPEEDRDELYLEVGDLIKAEELNGRQIRNTVRTAIALADHKKERLQAHHFVDVLKMTSDFTNYISRLRRTDPENLARLQGNRA